MCCPGVKLHQGNCFGEGMETKRGAQSYLLTLDCQAISQINKPRLLLLVKCVPIKDFSHPESFPKSLPPGHTLLLTTPRQDQAHSESIHD